MKDIVQRLRAGHQYSGIVDPLDIEAAAEIERLRAKHGGTPVQVVVAAIGATEEERRAAYTARDHNVAWGALWKRCENAEVESEWLRSELATFGKDTAATENRIIDAEFAAMGYAHEIEHLRAALAHVRSRSARAAEILNEFNATYQQEQNP